MTNYHLQLFPRLEPRTQQFNSGKDIPSTRVLTLDEAAKFASKHADKEVTPGDFLHAAAEGKITLRAIVHRTAKLQAHDGGIYCNRGTPDENTIPEWAIPNLPVCACQGLAVVGCAKWRTLDGFKLEGGELLRFTAATLVDGEPDFETVLTDCRVTADAAHALADAFTDEPTDPSEAGPEMPAASSGTPESAEQSAMAANEKPWLVADQRDPRPEQDWYTPARYFARQLVKDDSTLLTKRSKLAEKVSQSLAAVGIYKRGGKLPLGSGTVLKALSNVSLG